MELINSKQKVTMVGVSQMQVDINEVLSTNQSLIHQQSYMGYPSWR